MPISLEIMEDGHILWFRVEGTWKADDIAPAKQKTHTIFRAADHPVHALVDLRKANINLQLIMATQQVIGGEPLPNPGQVALVGVPRLIRMVAEPALKAVGSAEPIRFFDSFDDAKNYLRRYIKPNGAVK